MDYNYNKSFKMIPYILILCLLTFLFYEYYIYIFKNKLNNLNNIIPKNSVRVSPLSGEIIQNVTSDPPLLQVNYEYKDISKLYKVNTADIVVEEFSPYSDSLNYTGIFYSKNISLNESISSISHISVNSLPTINFIDYLDLNKYLFSNKINTLLISYTPDLCTNLIYKDNVYYYYPHKVQDINSFSNEPITFKNIIIDPDYLSKKVHTGLLFSGGKSQKLEIYNQNIKMINLSKDLPFSLLRGNTLWIKCIPSTKIITGYSPL